MQIPWLFPDFFPIFIFSLTFNKIPWLFPDFSQVWNFPDFSLTAGHPANALWDQRHDRAMKSQGDQVRCGLSTEWPLQALPHKDDTKIFKTWRPKQLKQLERLHSDDTPAASWLPILLSHIGSQVKRRQSQSYTFKEFVKIYIEINIYMTHLLKLLDMMCKYEMDPTSIVENTEQTRFCPQMDRRTRWNQYTPLSTLLKRGI